MEKDFKDFQIEEYKNISNAHFETNKQIGVFFRYILLIISAPSFIILWLGKDNPHFIDNLLNGNKELLNTNLFIGGFLILISIVGALSSAYLVSLKLDNILYARTINGVRRFFYEDFNIKYEDSYRVLPKRTSIPKYYDLHTFGVLYYAIALINSIYFFLGTIIIASVGDYCFPFILIKNYNIYWSLCIFLFVLLCHILYYSFASKYRRTTYLKTRIIGIDIDGVLNKHRETFCRFHQQNMEKVFRGREIPKEKKLTPEEITTIPVSSIKEKQISRDDEFDVFNNPQYWEEQESIDPNIANIIKELKNSYDYKINIHSYRPWPQYKPYGKLINKKDNLWGKKLTKITEDWLKNKHIGYNSLYIEKNSIDVSKRSFSIWGLSHKASKNSFKNRFYITANCAYRYFVEDDIDNAIKLAINCEYVFLVNQPYNQRDDKELPNNIIRVHNWPEIKSKIKELG